MEQEIIANVIQQYLSPYFAPVLVYVGVMLTVAGIAHTVAVGVLRPLAKFTPSKKDDRYVELSVWWTDAVADILREWALGKWLKGWQRACRMWEDRNKPLKPPEGVEGQSLTEFYESARRWE